MKKYIEAITSPMVLTYALGKVLGDLIEKGLNKVLPADWKF